jgi:hypothetical protein
VAAAKLLTQISSHLNNKKLDVINVSLVTLNNATLYNVYIPYITHLICIYCTIPSTVSCQSRTAISHPYIYMYIFLFIPLHLCVYKVVVLKLLDDFLNITERSELEAQAFRYTRINIC